MEEDYNFRSGTINPTLGENYFKKKWCDLTEKLNSVDSGPQLTVDEWKRRFKDWKNTTRQKSRKISESIKQTGGGKQLDVKLTAHEQRGIAVWGKSTVAGIVGVPEANGVVTPIFATLGTSHVLDLEVPSTTLEKPLLTSIPATLPSTSFAQVLDLTETLGVQKMVGNSENAVADTVQIGDHYLKEVNIDVNELRKGSSSMGSCFDKENVEKKQCKYERKEVSV